MNADGEITLSSFLAGALLKEKNITFIELTNYMGAFEEETNCNILDDGFEKLNDIIIYSDMIVSLKGCYDDLYKIGTVRDYLYSLTDRRVREFFKIKEVQTLENTINIKKNGLLKKIRTRVLHLL